MRVDNENSRPPPHLVSTHTLTTVTTALPNDQHSSGYDPDYSGSSMSVDGNSSRVHTSLDSGDSRLNQSVITADSNTSTTSTTSTKSTASTKSTTSTSSSKKSRDEDEEEGLEYASANGSGVDGDRSGSAMDLDDFNQLFGLGIDLDVGSVGIGDIGQPPIIQGSSTVTPAQLHLNSNSDSNQSNDVHDFDRDMSGISLSSQGSMDNLHLLDQYLDLALHNTKPFGSFSDFSSPLAGLVGNESSGLNRSIEMNSVHMQMRGRTLTGTNIALGERHQQDGGIAIAYPLSHYQHRSQPVTTASSPIAPPFLDTHSLTNYRSPNLLGYPCNTSGSSFGVSSVNGRGTSTTSSTHSFVQSSPEFVPPSSVSPLTLQYDSKGRVIVDPNGSASGGTGEGSLSLSNLGSDRLSFAFSELNGSGGVTSASRSPWIFQGDGGGVSSRSSARGTGASNLIMRRANSTLVGSSSSKLGLRRGMKKGAERGKQQQMVEMSIPLPIPTRSKNPSLIGWEGDSLTTMVTSTPASPPLTVPPQDILPLPPYAVSQTSAESRKRKRSPESDSDDGMIEHVEKVSRRELLGLRKISKDTQKKLGEEEELSGGERKRKRRRIGSLSGPQKKGKGKERRKIVWTSDDDGSDDSDNSDAYFPSSDPSSPGINNEPGPSSRPPKSMSRLRSLSSSCTNRSTYRRSSSALTLKTPESETTSISPENSKDEGDTKPHRLDKHKKGSAALALAKVTMLSGKSPTSVWGTYVPFPLDETPGEAIIRSGRTRRNGHIPLPVPVPDLIKKSRGRKVPHQESKRKLDDDDSKRVFVCDVLGCGKCFVRGEHLKRHVRSIHTHDKPHPCPYEGCDKSFSRRDNLGQHVRIHLQSSSS